MPLRLSFAESVILIGYVNSSPIVSVFKYLSNSLSPILVYSVGRLLLIVSSVSIVSELIPDPFV